MPKPQGTVPKVQDLDIYRGGTFYKRYELQNPDGPMDLTGFIGRVQIRRKRLSTDSISMTFVWEDAAQGKFGIYMSAAQTAALECGELPTSSASKYVWDCELQSPSGHVYPIQHGDLTVFAEVTR